LRSTGGHLCLPDQTAPTTSRGQNAMPDTTDRTSALLDALRNLCIDPDLGVNVVDMGFIRGARVDEDDVAIISMTLCSNVCPLGKIMSDQARAAIVGPIASELRLEFVWTPAWSPSDITDAGRERLAAIGFSGFGPLEVQSSRLPIAQ
jgi:metal-sulfur cluster biosynthetic enzyme